VRYKLIIRSEAENDLKEAFSWYEGRREGLGHEFLSQVKAGLTSIEKNPKTFPQEYKETRKCLIKRFPYKIIYIIEKSKVVVLAIVHHRRSPDLIMKRRDFSL